MDHYILNGKEVVKTTAEVWARWFETADRHVGDKTTKGVRISTVFLGLDHQFGKGPPLIFETLVFDGPLDGEMQRYSTWEEAEKGHEAMVKRVQDQQRDEATCHSTKQSP